ncbi:hypothetical protein TIFTF001_024618 [Ficus carica]|uniref:Uncharacterized protein n=1 Tax=Ficus carica TaxID=3494 RepID=A0AA88ALN7_FICCA|nr:hypothetical protein TIFTF001_024618 [Ficus carica]
MSDNKECVLSVEELSTMKNASIVGSTSNDNQSTEIGAISHDEAKVDERIRKLKILVEGAPIQSGERPPPKIQKVPFVLRGRKKFDKYYEPRVVSVGPIHHGKRNLRLSEQYKPKLAARFIRESGQETRALYRIIDDKIDQLKDYYHEDVQKAYDDKTLSWILFFDGCSVLQFIYDFVQDQLKDIMIKIDHIAFTLQDLFLLENQIPYEVLKLLIDSSRLSADLKKSMESFIRINIMAPPDYSEKLSIDMDNLDFIPIHLLDLLQHVLVLDNNKEKEKKDIGRRENQSPQTFRSVQELKKAGIDFKPSGSCSLTDITFNSSFFTGLLHLPPLVVDKSTATTFVNLIAYENCLDNFRTRYEVTSYISFLDSLIDHANDVKELRSTQILHNRLGSDEEVTSLFNEIGTDLVPNIKIYKDVRSDVMKYYKSKWMIKLAETYHDHFSSPSWTVLAFFGALLGLALSAIQTWFVVFQPSDPNHSCQH